MLIRKLKGGNVLKKIMFKLAVIGAVLCAAGCGKEEQERQTEGVAKEKETTVQNVKEEKTEKKTETERETKMYDTADNFASIKKDIEYGKLEPVEYSSNTTGSVRKANILLPPGYTEEKEYPVLYLLHGIGGNHTEWMGGNPGAIIGNLIAEGEAKEMIIVMPNVRARKNDAANPADIYTTEHFKAFDNFINELKNDLMPYIEANYSVAKGRENTAIAGLSMGGRESLYIGLTMPDVFGYVGAFCPAPGVLPYDVEAGLFTTDNFKLPEGYESLIMIVAGSNDTVVGKWPETYHQTLTNNGTEHIYYVTGGGHDFTVWKHGLYNFAKRIFDK